jgi:HAD superfamily hydrolase (TIGR01484 family)
MSHDLEPGRFLASDLDGTLIPPPDVPETVGGVAAFRAAVLETELRLAYVTGRHLGHALEGVRDTGLPRPEALACDVGTTLYWDRGGAYVPDREYEEAIRTRTGVIGARAVRAALRDLEALRLQEPYNQAEFKVSYYSEEPLADDLVVEIERRLSELGRARLVVSEDTITGEGLVDVLPEGVGKASAVAWLRERLELHESAVVFAGDSGNDWDALLASRSIVVANTPEALRQELRFEAERLGALDRLFFARSRFAVGVVEGLRHWGMVRHDGS